MTLPESSIYLVNVADDQLIASQAVKYILLVVLLAGIGFNIIMLFRSVSAFRKLIGAIAIVVLSGFAMKVVNNIDIDGQMLKNPQYTKGITIGMCEEMFKGKAVEFSYEVDGISYINCNTFHPLKLSDIKVPDGKYLVRYSSKYPSLGRMDFTKPAEKM